MADKINDGGPVYPCRITPSVRDVHALREAGNLHLLQARELAANHTGMSLRDAAALATLQGFAAGLASVKMTEKQADDAMEHAVRASWVVADAFIAARESKP
jgi:hypothetical protein